MPRAKKKNAAPQASRETTTTIETESDRSNSAMRGDTLREVHVNLDAYEAQIRGIREKMVEERARVKALDIRMADFNAVRRLRRLEDDDRVKAMDGLRECFEALMPGEQLDWVTGAGNTSSANAGNGAAHPDSKLARAAGREAGRGGKSATINPHAPGSDQHEAWRAGWMEGTAGNLPGKRTDDPFAADAR